MNRIHLNRTLKVVHYYHKLHIVMNSPSIHDDDDALITFNELIIRMHRLDRSTFIDLQLMA